MPKNLKKEDRQSALEKIRKELTDLKSSPLYAERVKNGVLPVLGEGSDHAEIMFVGEAPGKNEAETGRPFCGAAGKILDELLDSVNVNRVDVYITSIVKDRPPRNRDPLPTEIKAYAPILDKQIEIIQPKVLAALGRFGMAYLMEKFGLASHIEPISKIHGRSYEARASYGNIVIIPLYHPAALIYNKKLKDVLKKDFQIIKKYAKK